LLIVDYVPTALFIRSAYKYPVQRITITLNPEAIYYRDLRRSGRVPTGSSASWVANLRVANFESWVYRRSHAIVGLSRGDFALAPFWKKRVVMMPLFTPHPRRWDPAGRGHIFFVGNAGHYPNTMAIEWLATRLAPALEARGGAVRIRIIGADATGVPSHWQRANIDYLGIGNAAMVEDEFTAAELFVSPISNSFGSKMKMLQCLAHCTPAMATRESLSGLPFLDGVPTFKLHQPHQVAAVVTSLVSDGQKLCAISAGLEAQLKQQVGKQRGQWSSLLHNTAKGG
jgi:hypothetical protein